MNKVYKSKWNNASGQWVAVSELVKGKSKNSRLCKGILSSALVTVGIATGSLAYAGVINNSADKSTTASGAYPISDIVTNGSATVINRGGIVNTTGSLSNAIYAFVGNNTGKATVFNTGVVTTTGTQANALAAKTVGGDILMANTGALSSSGSGTYGIYATSTSEDISITNTGAITNLGQKGYGIFVTSTSGNVNIQNTGDIISSDGQGIYANSAGVGANVTVNSSGNITTNKNLVAASNGIEVSSQYGTNTVIFDNGTIKTIGNSIGIASYDRSSASVDNKSFIYVGANGVVDTSLGRDALLIRTNGYGEINIAKGALVTGGTRAAIYTGAIGTTAATHVINNAGTLESTSDVIIFADTTAAGSTLTFNNKGEMTGNAQVVSMNTTLQNDNLWRIRDFQDTNSDGVRDTKSVAISNFGSGTNTVNNTGTLNLSAVSGETSVNNAGEYIPIGALSITHAGTVQGQLLNLNTFDNSGLIDMTANNQAGDVLVITGGVTAGVNGEGTYISNGGSLKLNTLLNQGGQASQTDILVLDNIQLGTNGATKVYVSPAIGSLGAYTPGDGIKIIETLGDQDTRAFTLGQPLLSGAYEYQLFAYDAQGTQNGFYLRSQLNNDPLYNPNIGSYLGNQYATSTMFNQNILDRRNSVRNTNKNIWMRTNYNETRYDQLGGRQHTKTDNTLVQAGIDIIRHQDFTAGAYIGYGQSRTKNHSNQTGTRANAKANGYQVGLYGTWMPDQNQGPYVDTWAHYAWYKNKLEGQAQQNDNVKYDSHGYALSVEAGYGFNLATTQSGRMWIIQPHAQIIYNNLKTKNFTDNNYTYFANQSASGISTRLGARFYGQEPADKQGILPFVEANWLHNGVKNKVKLGGSNVDEKIGQNVGELKLGINGQVNNKVSVFGHIGGQLGSHDYKRGEVQIGFNFNW